MSVPNFLSYLSTVLVVCVTVGGFFALRQGYSKQTNEIQERIITALKTQNEIQAAQIAACEKEIARLKRIVSTIQYALKRRGVRIEIDGEGITFIDNQAGRTHTIQMQLDEDDTPPANKTTKETP